MGEPTAAAQSCPVASQTATSPHSGQNPAPLAQPVQARVWKLSGRVQGVGMRPFLFRQATELGLSGFVRNRGAAVEVHAEGPAAVLRTLADRLVAALPAAARIDQLDEMITTAKGYPSFTILPSLSEVDEVRVPLDRAHCARCLAEVCDPGNRRYAYPFTHCCDCGPRYTVLRTLPCDRAHTALDAFPLCGICLQEYQDPSDHRFHAEPTSCASCGPQLCFVEMEADPNNDKYAKGTANAAASPRIAEAVTKQGDSALQAALACLRAGRILALKGVGGYQLLVDASQAEAVARLRQRKRRPHKPFAVLCPETDALVCLRNMVCVDPVSLDQLSQPSRPIVLLPIRGALARGPGSVAAMIAPGLRELGVMLPASPLHALLARQMAGPLVATSGNLGGEPLIADHAEALLGLAGVADAFLYHDRAIVRAVDDAVMRPIANVPRVLRLGRGLAPLEWTLPRPLPHPVLALGGQQKNAVALGWGSRVVLSPHIGDLDTLASQQRFEQMLESLCALYRQRPEQLLCDAHAGYYSHRWAIRRAEQAQSPLPVQSVLHHHAHASALAGEHGLDQNWLVFTWDALGAGPDGTLWGGEALAGRPGCWQRYASLRPFRLPGGDLAARQPWRSAAALCWETGLNWPAPEIVRQAWERSLNCHQTTAAGRLFDGAAALLGLLQDSTFEGQAPMWLEACAGEAVHSSALDPSLLPALPLYREQTGAGAGLWRSDWAPLLHRMLDRRIHVSVRARLFHEALAAVIETQALSARSSLGSFKVGLCGGVFQNRLLTERAMSRLQAQGFEVYLPQRVPSNDGGLAFGQIIEYLHTGDLNGQG